MENKEQLAVSTMAPTSDSGQVEPLREFLLKLQRPTSTPHLLHIKEALLETGLISVARRNREQLL